MAAVVVQFMMSKSTKCYSYYVEVCLRCSRLLLCKETSTTWPSALLQNKTLIENVRNVMLYNLIQDIQVGCTVVLKSLYTPCGICSMLILLTK